MLPGGGRIVYVVEDMFPGLDLYDRDNSTKVILDGFETRHVTG